MDGTLKTLYDAVMEGQRDVAKECVEMALADGVDPGEILDAMVQCYGGGWPTL